MAIPGAWRVFLVLTLVLAGSLPERSRGANQDQPPKRVPIILDCDIGTDIDDTFAVALALASPELDLRGVTTVSGDTQKRARMVCRILTAIGRKDVPVAAGRVNQPPQALRGFQEQYVGHPAVLYGRTQKPLQEPAVEFLYRQLKAHPGQLTLVAVGPLSNAAQLLTEHPDCKPWLKRLVIMGGSIRVGYNNKAPINAEFNIRADPKAARTVFTSGVPLTVAPLDATTMLDLDPSHLQRIFGAHTMLNYQVQALFQLWDQKHPPTMYDPVAVTLAFQERFCKMENLHIEVDDRGFTRESPGKPNTRVATGIDKEAFLKWFADRFAAVPEKVTGTKIVNRSALVERGGFPNRVHTFEDFETDIERRWWLSGKPETTLLPPGSQRACRGVLTQDFDGQLGNQKTMYTAVVFNPVPGPPMGKKPRLSFRYWLKGTDTLRVQIYSLSNGYHRCLTLTGLPQEKWQIGCVDLSAARRPDGSGGPLSENERIDDIQFYCDPRAELLIDDIVLHDAAVPGEKRPFPERLQFTGWFDTGKQGQEWPGAFEVVPKKGFFWNAARSVAQQDAKGSWLRLYLRGERPVGARTQLFFRYQLSGSEDVRVALVQRASKKTWVVPAKVRPTAEDWAEATVNFSGENAPRLGERVDEVQFLLPRSATLLVDDVLLYAPGK